MIEEEIAGPANLPPRSTDARDTYASPRPTLVAYSVFGADDTPSLSLIAKWRCAFF